MLAFMRLCIRLCTHLCTALVLSYLVISPAASMDTVHITADEKEVPLGMHTYHLEDKTRNLELQHVLSSKFDEAWIKSTEENPNFGYTSSAYWFAIDIDLENLANDQWILVLGNSVLEHIDFYLVDGNKNIHIKTGNSKYFTDRAISHRKFIFELPLTLNSTKEIDSEKTTNIKVLLRIDSKTPLQVPISLWQQQEFHAQDQKSLLGLGIYYGTMIIILIYNLFLFFSIRDKSYLYFILFIAFSAISQSMIDGIAYQYLWKQSPWWNSQFIFSSLPLSFLFIWLFTLDFLNLKTAYKKLTITIYIAVFICSLLSIVAWFGVGKILLPLIGLCSILTYTGALSIGIYTLFKGNKEAAIFSLAWASYFIGSTLYVLKLFGIIPRTFWTNNAAPIALIILVNLLSIALAYRFNLEKRAKKDAQDAIDEAQRKIFIAKQGQAEEQNKAETLQILDKQKTAFFQNISHELRTPLTLILNPLEEECQKPQVSENITMAAKNSRRLLRLVNQVLDFQKLSASALNIELRAVNLTEFMRIAGDYFSASSTGKNISVSLIITGQPLTKDAVDIYIMANLDSLEKIVFNFLSNALKFTPDNGTIELGISCSNNRAKIYVKDSGIGISTQDQAALFQVFSQVDESTTREHEGSGIGLALAKQLTEKMQGNIGIESQPNNGSTFWCDFPCCDASEQAYEEIKIKDWLLEKSVSNIQKNNSNELQEKNVLAQRTENDSLILVIDDLFDMRRLISEILIRNGYLVISAEDGEQGLEKIKQHNPSIIISDWMMPKLSGPDLIKILKEDPLYATIPVILLTAKTDEESKMQGIEMGANAFLGKPFNDQELISTVRNLIILKSRESKLEETLTALKDTQKALLDVEKMASLGYLVAGVSHEINTPLGVVITLLTHLIDETSQLKKDFSDNSLTPAILTEYLNASTDLIDLSHTNLQRTLEVVNRFKQVSIQYAAFDKKEFHLSEQLNTWSDSIKDLLKRKHHSLMIDCPEDIILDSYPAAIGQILTILVNNSVQHGYQPQEQGKLQLTISQQKTSIVFTYTDNGQGMPAEVLNNIFEPFFTTHRASDNSGFGMYVAYNIASKTLKGTIECQSEPSQGVKITINMPTSTEN
jgi:signal transduction histidine kinase